MIIDNLHGFPFETPVNATAEKVANRSALAPIMSIITDHAICIRSWDFSETSQTISLFTREHGIIRGLAKGAKREKGNFSGGLDVLTRGEMVANVKAGRDLALITAWHLQSTWRWLRLDLRANRAALYMADLVHHMLVEHDPHPIAFDGLVQAIESMESPSQIAAALLQFQWMLLTETGYQPQIDRDSKTGATLPTQRTFAFSARAGGIVAEPTGNFWKVRSETVALLQRIANQQPLDQISDETIGRGNRLLAAYFREIIGSEPPSMRWAFPDLTR